MYLFFFFAPQLHINPNLETTHWYNPLVHVCVCGPWATGGLYISGSAWPSKQGLLGYNLYVHAHTALRSGGQRIQTGGAPHAHHYAHAHSVHHNPEIYWGRIVLLPMCACVGGKDKMQHTLPRAYAGSFALHWLHWYKIPGRTNTINESLIRNQFPWNKHGFLLTFIVQRSQGIAAPLSKRGTTGQRSKISLQGRWFHLDIASSRES